MNFKKLCALSLAHILSLSPAYAGLITHIDYTSGNAVTAAGQNTNENTIVTVINGNLDTTNISPTAALLGTQLSGAANILGTQLTNNTVGNPQLSSSSVNGATANSGGTTGTIRAGTISTPDIRDNAVTLSSFTSSRARGGAGGANILVQSSTVTLQGGPVLLIGNVHATGVGATQESVQGSIARGSGTQGVPGAWCVNNIGTDAGGVIMSCVIIAIDDSLTTGTTVYNLYGAVSAGGTVDTSTRNGLIVIELRK